MAKTSRKSHNKTRSGCQTCKRRKIKCDEERPSCQNCIKHDVQCDFELLANVRRGRSSQNVSAESLLEPSAPRPTLRSHISPSQNQVSQQSSSSHAASPVLPLSELKLLHNFCCSTCYTFSSNETLRTLWRINIPQLGFTHEYVMRGLLALSALHLAHVHESDHEFYSAQAACHQQAALNTVMPLLNEITTENSPGLYMFSIQTVIYSLGSPRKPGDLLLVGNGDTVPNWLYLLRGTKSIIILSAPTLHASILAPMFHVARRRSEHWFAATSKERHLEDLRAQINEVVDQPMANVYAETIDSLQRTFAVASNVLEGSYEFTPTHIDLYDVFTWPYFISDEYLSYLQEFEPAALAILAHFCVLLQALDAHWWMQGWGKHLIATIFSSLSIEYRPWIQWPVEEIGWIPTNLELTQVYRS